MYFIPNHAQCDRYNFFFIRKWNSDCTRKMYLSTHCLFSKKHRANFSHLKVKLEALTRASFYPLRNLPQWKAAFRLRVKPQGSRLVDSISLPVSIGAEVLFLYNKCYSSIRVPKLHFGWDSLIHLVGRSS